MKILIVSYHSDLHAHAVQWGLERLGAGVKRLEVTEALARHEFDIWSDERGLRFVLDGEVLDDVAAIWLRRAFAKKFFADDAVHPLDVKFAHASAHHFYEGFLQALATDRLCIHPLGVTRRAEAKCVQLAVARSVGFNVCETLFTNSTTNAIAFVAREGSVAKPLAQHYWRGTRADYGAATTPVTIGDLKAGARSLRSCPMIFQRRLSSIDEVRVTVVGSNMFCASLGWGNKGGVRPDWRVHKDEIAISALAIPGAIRQKIGAYCSSLSLLFAAIDFIIDDSGEWWFLEANPGGQWLWMNDETLGLPVYDCFVQFLLSGDRNFVYVEQHPKVSLSDYYAEVGHEFVEAMSRNKAAEGYHQAVSLEG